jgi:hypothetical protein
MFSSIALAQEPGYVEVVSWIAQMGSWSLLLWLIGGALIFLGFLIFRPLGHFTLFKWFCYGGLFIIFIATFGVQIRYILPYLGTPVISFAKCEGAFASITVTADPISNFVIGTACIFSGYAPSEFSTYAITTFFIFGIIAPLGVLMALFYEFTDFLENENVRKVMTFLSALIAFRFLLASMFTELLGYGFAGLGILAVNYFFFMVVLRMMRGLWKGYEATEKALTMQDREILSSLISRRGKLQDTIAVTTDPTMKATYQADLNKVNEDIKTYAKKVKTK